MTYPLEGGDHEWPAMPGLGDEDADLVSRALDRGELPDDPDDPDR